MILDGGVNVAENLVVNINVVDGRDHYISIINAAEFQPELCPKYILLSWVLASHIANKFPEWFQGKYSLFIVLAEAVLLALQWTIVRGWYIHELTIISLYQVSTNRFTFSNLGLTQDHVLQVRMLWSFHKYRKI